MATNTNTQLAELSALMQASMAGLPTTPKTSKIRRIFGR